MPGVFGEGMGATHGRHWEATIPKDFGRHGVGERAGQRKVDRLEEQEARIAGAMARIRAAAGSRCSGWALRKAYKQGDRLTHDWDAG